MNDHLYQGTEAEVIVLRSALRDYHRHAELRYDPTFVPKPGKQDRNKLAMDTATELLRRLPEAGKFSININEAETRCIRNAIDMYVGKMDLANALDDKLPAYDFGDAPRGEAIVERRSRWAN